MAYPHENCVARSRIENEIDRMRSLIDIVNSSTSRITRHASSFGYFAPPPAQSVNLGCAPQAPTAVAVTLTDVLDELARAIDSNSGALNLFD
jgi:hypothetical protein